MTTGAGTAARRLEGKTIMVTGAAGGIGRALVRALVAEGARVAAVDIAAATFDATDERVLSLACDISDDTACEDAVAACIARFGRIDGLVNNAGISLDRIRPDYEDRPIAMEEVSPEFWRRVFAVNATGTFFATRAVVPRFRAQGSGRVISVTTSFFTMLRRGWASYGGSKAAIEAASAGWAAEFAGTGITVNVLVPGRAGRHRDGAAAGVCRPGVADPARGHGAARPAWLLSDAAAAVTGRRFVAAKWDPALPEEEAAAESGSPIGWPDLAAATVVWPGAGE